MSKYIRSIKKEFDFDGDKVVVTMRPILFEDTIRFNSLPLIEVDGKKTLSEIEVLTLLADILPKYIEKLDGLIDSNGDKIEIGELCSASYFAPLMSQIGGALIQSGTPENPKKPGEQ